MLDLPTAKDSVDVAVFGGSGFYSFLDDIGHSSDETPYGATSTPPVIGTVGDRRVAFIARHGHGHTIPAHRVNYRANVWAMAALGARAVIAPFACGSLRRELAPGHLVVVDQQVDRTSAREATFFDGPQTYHHPFADPYDKALSTTLADAAEAQGLTVHRGGTVVVVSGPRFSSRAESAWHRTMGWDLVNMTQAPEAALAGEAGLRYVGVALVTDYDVGLEDDATIRPVTQEEVFAHLNDNAAAMRTLLHAAIPLLEL